MIKIDLISEKISEDKLKWINSYWPKLSKYSKESHVKRISNRLEITKELVKVSILFSLEGLGWDYHENLKDHHIFWLSLIETCIDEKSPLNRWEKAKSKLFEALTEWFSKDPVFGVYAIVRDSRIPIEAIPRGPFIMKLLIPSFIEYCLRTVILFNTRDCDIPSEVFIDAWTTRGRPNFCDWSFHRGGTLFEVKLRNGNKREKFVPKLQLKDIWQFRDPYSSSCFLFKGKYGTPVKTDLKDFLCECGFPRNSELGEYKDMISTMFRLASLEKIKKWLKGITGKNLDSEDEMKKELRHGYLSGLNKAIAQKYFPEFENDAISFKATPNPYWVPDNWLLDLQKLKIDLGDLYLSSLSKAYRIKAFKKFADSLKFDLFNYENFRSIMDDWEKEGDYKSIQSILNSFKRGYSPSKIKKEMTNRDYAFLCLKVIKEKLNTGSTFKDAARVVAKKIKTENLSLKANLTPEQIRVRASEVMKKENRVDKYDLKSDEGLRYLYRRIIDKYNFQDSEI